MSPAGRAVPAASEDGLGRRDPARSGLGSREHRKRSITDGPPPRPAPRGYVKILPRRVSAVSTFSRELNAESRK